MGILIEKDHPVSAALSSGGAVGDTAELRAEWREFVRVDINKRWYIVSDYMYARFYAKFIKVDEAVLGLDVNSNGNKTDKLWNNNSSIEDASNATTGF